MIKIHSSAIDNIIRVTALTFCIFALASFESMAGADTIVSGNIATNTTWSLTNSPYVVTNDISVGSNAILTIEPGVVVKINGAKSITVGNGSLGAINARGTAALPITFTSAAATPAAGDWGNIYFGAQTNTSLSVIDNVIVEYAGYYTSSYALSLSAPIQITNSIIRKNKHEGVYIQGASATVTNSRFENNAGYAVAINYTATASSPVLRNNTYLSNTVNGISINNTALSHSTTWTKDNAPYYILNDLSIYANPITNPAAVLTIEPGVTAKFVATKSLQIGNGGPAALDARGTAALPITFTSASATPVAGDWNKIFFGSSIDSAKNFIDYIVVEYGGTYTNDAAISTYFPVQITNSIIRNNKNNGLLIYNGISPTIVKNQFLNNTGYGILNQNNSAVSVSLNTFLNNLLGGVSSNATSSVSAKLNWWGSSTGPSGIGPGTGQAISGNVSFDPWMGEAFNSNIFFNNAVASPTKFNQVQNQTTFTASLSKTANWQIQIRNTTGIIVKTLTGVGAAINQQWVGDDTANQPLPNGTYTYVISATAIAAPVATATVIGKVMLDNTIPIAKISSPAPFTLLANQVSVSGTAAGGGFSSYTLEYGVGENPISWSLIATSTVPVTNGVLGTWTIQDFPNPNGRIRLTVRNAASVTAVDSIPVSVLSIYNLADTPDPFSPNADSIKDTTSMTANFTYTTNFTLSIKDASLAVVKSFSGIASSLNFIWDGKNSSGLIVPNGTYSYQVALTYGGVSALSKVGTVTLDTTLPTASITSPVENAVVSGMVTVTGTASDVNFNSYKLEYGIGAAPTSWTIISTSTTQVLNNTLGIWDTLKLANGSYMLRLTVNDNANNTVQVLRKVSLDNILITNVSTSPKFIDPSLGEISTLAFTLDRAANVTIEVYRLGVTVDVGNIGEGYYFREFLFNLITDVPKSAGAQSINWNGKNLLGQVLPASAYGYIIKPTSGVKSGLWDPEYVPGSVSLTNLSLSPANFNPFANEPVQLNYNLSAPAWVTVGVELSQTFNGFIVAGKPSPAGLNTEIWDGRDSTGTIYKGIVPITVSIKTEILPEVVTVIKQNTLQITNFKTNPYLIFPTYNELTKINYTINRTANIILRVIDPNGNSWIIAQVSNQIAGSYTLEWKGRASDGTYLRTNGNYRLELTAMDPVTNISVKRLANMSLYR